MTVDTLSVAPWIRRALLAASALVALAGPASAQQRLVTVRVLDSLTGDPIHRAAVEPRSVALPSALAPRFTDGQGRAHFAFTSDDPIEFTVRSIGFASARRVVTPGSNDTVTVHLARLPVHLDAMVAAAVDNNCPTGMGRAADQVNWENVVNALAIAADYEAESTFSFEVRSIERLRNLADTVTDQSEIIERSGAAPSISAQSADWLAENGFVSREDDTVRVEVPSPSVLASPRFEQTHCFIFAGDSEGLVRLRFAPLLNSRVADISGEMLLADSTLAPLAVHVEYATGTFVAGREDASLDFDQSQRGTTYLRDLSLDLPLFDGSRAVGTISEGQHVQLIEGDGHAPIDGRAGGNVRVDADCGTLSLDACLVRGNDEWSGKLNGGADPLRALAYYGAICRAGPSRELAGMAADTEPTVAEWLALIEARGSRIDSARVERRSAVLDALSTERPDQLSATQRSVFAEIVQLDACSRRGIALGFERATLGIRSEGARTATLIASCLADEGLACLWVAPTVVALEPSDAAVHAGQTLLERACALEVERACQRLTIAVTPAVTQAVRLAGSRPKRGAAAPVDSASHGRPESLARAFLAEDTLPSPSLVDSYAVRVAGVFADRAMTDLDVFPEGVLETINPEIDTPSGLDGMDPADSTELDGIAGLLRGRRDLRALVVIHPDASSAAVISSHDSARDKLDREAASFEAWFEQHGVSSGQVRIVTVPQGDAAASMSTLLGRQVQRRLEIAIRVPGDQQ